MPGRRPKPAALKILQGNAGKRPIPEEFHGDKSLPEPPKDLSAGAKKEFLRISKLLTKAGILDQLDVVSLSNYCKIYDRMIKAEKDLKRNGSVMTDKYGAPVISPYFKVVSQCLEQLKFYFSSFGMTPSDRAKMSNQMNIEKEEKKDPLEELLGNG